jgi:alanine dehydrogenase
MIIGTPKEITKHEYRVGITPEGVGRLRHEGHRLIIEQTAGEGSGFSDEDYRKAGAEISEKADLFREADLIVKVKEPLPSEFALFCEGQGLFTFLHLAANPDLVDILIKKRITALAYETLEEKGATTLLEPMSEIAGRMAPLIGAFYMQKIFGGSGTLITGVEGGKPARVVILGAGVVGMNALKVAFGMGADIVVLNRGHEKLENIDSLYKGAVKTRVAAAGTIEAEVLHADLLIGAVMVTGARAPRLVSRELVSKMKRGAVIVDVAVDQGGCVETTRQTTHDDPVYSIEGVIHYAVGNMPGAFPRTSTAALTSRTIEYISLIAESGIERALDMNGALKSALNIHRGKITHSALAGSLAGEKRKNV